MNLLDGTLFELIGIAASREASAEILAGCGFDCRFERRSVIVSGEFAAELKPSRLMASEFAILASDVLRNCWAMPLGVFLGG